MIASPVLLVAFVGLAGGLLAFDLLYHRADRPITIAHASLWSVFYVVAAFAFAGLIWHQAGREAAILFLSGYGLEKMLSLDNLFIFVAIFTYFGIDPAYQHRILHWGIIGAIVFRFIFVAVGVGSLWLFGPVAETVFAILILYTAYMIWSGGDETEVDYSEVWYIRATRKVLPVTPETSGHRFFIGGRATPLFVCLVAIEVADILFAFDSVPAIIVITRDPFLIFSAMIFAVMGLRSLYFVLAALRRELAHVETAVVILLILFALNVLSRAWLHVEVDPLWGLIGIGGIIGAGVLASILTKPKGVQS